MAYKQQEYTPGQAFNSYTWAELSSDPEFGENWQWDNRTLSGFRLPDGSFVGQGGEFLFSGTNAQVSGVWTLDRNRTVILLADDPDGVLFADVTLKTREKPTPGEEHVGLTAGESYAGYFYSDLSVQLRVPDGYVISKARFNGWKTQMTGFEDFDPDQLLTYSGNSANGGLSCWISAVVVQGGVLEYVDMKRQFQA